MRKNHEKPKLPRIAEPVQVYLDLADRNRLATLSAELGATKSEVLRRGLAALERQLVDPAEHPALRIIGIAANHPELPAPHYDVAREHDRFFAETEAGSWRPLRKKQRRAR